MMFVIGQQMQYEISIEAKVVFMTNKKGYSALKLSSSRIFLC